MAKRTKDEYRFEPCPICEKLPRVVYHMCNCGVAYCDGGIFKKHKGILAEVGYAQPSNLQDELAKKWEEAIDQWYKEE